MLLGENPVFFSGQKTLNTIHVQSTNKLPSRTQTQFYHLDFVRTLEPKVLSSTILREPGYVAV